MIINMNLSAEEKNLYNPAYVGTILYQSIREYQSKDKGGLHCALVYLIAPLALSNRYSSILPSNITTPLAGWASNYEGNLTGFSESVNAYIDIVNSAIIFLLELDAITLDEHGFYQINKDLLPKSPAIVNKNDRFKTAFTISGFLGRWFSQVSSVESIYTHLGVKP